MSFTEDLTEQSWFKWYHLYFCLAAFDILAVSTSLYLNHAVIGVYSSSVEENSVWSNRVSLYSRLNELAAEVNAPGNDAFESGDIANERERLEVAYQAIQKAIAVSSDDLQSHANESEASTLLQMLEEIDLEVALIHSKAIGVLFELENKNQQAAGSLMAAMDRSFSRSLGHIGTLCESVRQIQSNRFDVETKRAHQLGQYEILFVCVVCLILCVAIWYGNKMAAYMQFSDEEVRLSKQREMAAMTQHRADLLAANQTIEAEVLARTRELKKQALELQESKQKTEELSAFGDILDKSLNEIFICDVKTLHFVHANYGARDNTGYSMQELREMTPLDITPTEPKASFEKLVGPLLDGTKANVEYKTVHRRKDGSEYPVEVHLETSVLGAREVFVAIALDITLQKQVEAKLIASTKAAETANRTKSEFLANMSHEIRTPMTAILGFTDLLLDNVKKPENIEAIRTVKENGNYLLNLINDILDLSKIEAGKCELEQIACSPHEIVADVTSLMQVRAAAKGLPLEIQFDGPVPKTIQSDPTRIRQILINIVGNAIKFTETGSVQIVTRLLSEPGQESRLQFEVIDSGIGIAVGSIEKLFTVFTQADNSTTRQFGGTGLGLAISKRLVELLGGEFAVSSTQGEGSSFSFTVMTGSLDDTRMIHNTSELNIKIAKADVVHEKHQKLDHLRILLAEDGPDNQRLIGFVLKKAGAEVALADNGQMGLDSAMTAYSEGNPFDVILMDMQMPVLDGYQATQQLREQGYTGPIIALTAHAMSGDRKKCIDAGCDDYTTKPIDRGKLIQLVAKAATGEFSQI